MQVAAERPQSLKFRRTALAGAKMGLQPSSSGFLKLPIDVSPKAGKNRGAVGSIRQEGFHCAFARSPSIC